MPFASVEVNSTYYGIPRPGTMELLDRRTPDEFAFMVKAHQSMTHDKAGPSPEQLAAFRECLAPLRAAGKLRGILLQFPWAFRPTQGARRRLEGLHEALSAEAPLFVEFRHAAWLVPRVFEFLAERRKSRTLYRIPVIVVTAAELTDTARLAICVSVRTRLATANALWKQRCKMTPVLPTPAARA